MFQIEGERSEEPKPAEVLVDVPSECRSMLNKVIKLVDPRFQSVVAHVLHIVPKEILMSIIAAAPDCKLRIIECLDSKDNNIKRVRYASITTKWATPECLKNVDWGKIMGPFTDQMDHDVCWAVVVSELIRAVRLIEKPNQDPKISGFKYVMKNGIQLEEDRPFNGCSANIPARESSRFGYIKGFVKLNSIETALRELEGRPIGAALALFHPEYKNIGNKVYRGPVNYESMFCGLHAVSLLNVGEENGEKYVLARTSHGATFGCDGCIKVSLEVMLAYIPVPGEEISEFIQKYLGTPKFLLTRFSYPTLFTDAEEEIRKKQHLDELKNLRRIN
ncbi:unnamed protein product [Microthlaspi erraticum]|uniref:Peptidase C1A papain C-terminal domain-containing protein n=1 Tax=Microthlaspi erraticum TaxID=1685480 RepID=A0A6D2HHS9_9BRAS|nr:unnamed protein product [Microthlaspi erraticum]